MRKSIVLALSLTLGGLGQPVSATPIISQVSRSAVAQVAFNNNISDAKGTQLVGPAYLSANASDVEPSIGYPGFDTLHAQSVQNSTVDVFGFSYEATLEADGIFHSLQGGANAISRLSVTYVLDVPYVYQFTLTGGGMFDSLPFQGPFPKSGVLQPGSYTFQVGDLQLIVLSEKSPQPRVTATETATLQLSPASAVPEGDLAGTGLLLAFAVSGLLGLSKFRMVRA